MQFLGFNLTRTKAVPTGLQNVNGSNRGWWPIIRESFAGAWQTNTVVTLDSVMTYAAVYACVALISSDIGKLRLKLVKNDGTGIWTETENPAFSPVLRKPNHYQTRIQFFEHWLTSKLMHGNTYVLKLRDERRVVVDQYVLDPCRVRPFVAPDKSVYYELKQDFLSGVTDEAVMVPASEIIHDRMNAWFHPLVGISPITACGISAIQGLRIQDNSAQFFGNGSKPGGVLTAPGNIPQDTATRLKEYWDTNFSGENTGKVAVLGDGLHYEQMAMSATDSQLIEQLKWTAENVCVAFLVPPYKVNVGPPPNYNNIEALDQQYYSQCLQRHIESIEILQDEGLGLSRNGEPQVLGTEFELDDLMRMDTASRVAAAKDSIGGAGMSVNESRRRYHGLGGVDGGDNVTLQQQQFSVAALAERDRNDPFSKPAPAPPAAPAAALKPADDASADPTDKLLRFSARLSKGVSALAVQNATQAWVSDAA